MTENLPQADRVHEEDGTRSMIWLGRGEAVRLRLSEAGAVMNRFRGKTSVQVVEGSMEVVLELTRAAVRSVRSSAGKDSDSARAVR